MHGRLKECLITPHLNRAHAGNKQRIEDWFGNFGSKPNGGHDLGAFGLGQYIMSRRQKVLAAALHCMTHFYCVKVSSSWGSLREHAALESDRNKCCGISSHDRTHTLCFPYYPLVVCISCRHEQCMCALG